MSGGSAGPEGPGRGHVSFEALVDWWTGEPPEADLERVELHLMGCSRCAAEAERVGAVVTALRATVPPVVSRGRLEALRARGLRIEENRFAPGVRQTAVFRPEVDLLVHRLGGLDLTDAARVEVSIESESGGPLVEVPDAPFDREAGEVLVACQQHFRSLPPDVVVRVTTREASGREREVVFFVPHQFSP